MSVVLRQQFSGDPGLFGFVGKALKAATGLVGGLNIPLVSGAARTVSGLLPGGRGSPPDRVIPGAGRQLALPGGGGARFPVQTFGGQNGLPVPGVRGFAQRLFPGGATGLTTIVTPDDTGGIAPRGHKLNKTGYFRTDPNTGDTIFIPPQSIWVKVRRRNPGNARANDRAISRITSAKRMAKHLGRISIREKC